MAGLGLAVIPADGPATLLVVRGRAPGLGAKTWARSRRVATTVSGRAGRGDRRPAARARPRAGRRGRAERLRERLRERRAPIHGGRADCSRRIDLGPHSRGVRGEAAGRFRDARVAARLPGSTPFPARSEVDRCGGRVGDRCRRARRRGRDPSAASRRATPGQRSSAAGSTSVRARAPGSTTRASLSRAGRPPLRSRRLRRCGADARGPV